MSFPAYFRSIVARFFHRSRVANEMEEELLAHVQLRADDLERAGMNRAEAERNARIELGARGRFREECHEALGANLLETLLHDLRFALRALRKSPGFVIVAVLTLALAIGANAVVFAVLNAFFLHPLNLPRSQDMYAIQRGNDTYISQSYPDYVDLRDRNRSFEGLVAYDIAQAGIDTGQNPSSAWLYEVSGNYFDALGIQPSLGRLFHNTDERGSNSAPYIVLSHAYWHSYFQDDRNIVGRVVRLDKHPFTIVGVAPPDFRGTLLFFSPDFFIPMVNQQQIDGEDHLNARGKRYIFEVNGRLKPGITPAQATADLNSVGSYLSKTYPKDDGQTSFSLVRPGLHGNFFAPAVRAFMAGLMLLAGLILLAACTNLGTLFAARAADRGREVALRLALGSSRTRILRQLLIEAILISVVGGAVGLWGSVVLLHRLSAWQPFPQFPIHMAVNPDANVYLVALFLALVSGLLFAAVPVRQVLRTNPFEIVKAGATTTAGGQIGRRIGARDLALVAQIAICAVLVTSSMVAVRGLIRSLHSTFGFVPQNAMLVNTELTMAGYRSESVPSMQRRMIDAMQAIPGVTSVGLVSIPPLHMGWEIKDVFREDTTDLRPPNALAETVTFRISPDYFQAAGTALLMGRNISWQDDQDAPRVAVVNREFARKVLGSAPNALGRHFKLADGARVEVVGIVEDGKYTANLAEDPLPAMFRPILQSPVSETWLVLRSNRDPQQLAAAVRSTLRGLDAGLPAFIQTWTEEMNGALFASRMAALSLGVLGFMGAILSITCIFGMAAYSVSKRLKELGIRVALGAQRVEVLQAAIGRAVRLLALGSAAGLLLGVLASRVLASIVYSATPRDPLVLAAVVLAMAFLGLLATWIPAQRALSVNPLVLLREE